MLSNTEHVTLGQKIYKTMVFAIFLALVKFHFFYLVKMIFLWSPLSSPARGHAFFTFDVNMG